MSKPEWGLKRVCPSCGTRYYDLRKKQPVCPSCGTVFDPEALMKSRRSRVTTEEKTRRPIASPELIEEGTLPEGEDPENAVIEDADELGEDVDVDVEVAVEREEVDDADARR